MEFRITASLARLSDHEQKAVKTPAFDLQLDHTQPGLNFHRLDRARNINFWSVRVNDNLRLIVHKTEASLLLCYVDHHAYAYAWALRRKIERHPTTGAAQLVEVREVGSIAGCSLGCFHVSGWARRLLSICSRASHIPT